MDETGDSVYGGVAIGDPVFDEGGNKLGAVRGLDSSGFYVLASDTEAWAPIHDARDISGVAYVMWRCWECGEMGQLEEELPAACPACGAPREDLYYWAED